MLISFSFLVPSMELLTKVHATILKELDDLKKKKKKFYFYILK